MNRTRLSSSLRGAIVAALVAGSIAPARAELKLHYAMDGYTYADRGSPPAAPGTIVGTSNPNPDTPGEFSCHALDLNYLGGSPYLTTTTDVEKIDALSAMTVTFWLNMRYNPASSDCLLSDLPDFSFSTPAGVGGWNLTISGVGANPPTANSFLVSFAVCQSQGGGVSQCQGSNSAAIDANRKWVFVAVSYDTTKRVRYYLGSPTTAAAQIGSTFLYSYPLLNNDSELRVGSDTSSPGVDRTPPAYVDDLRIYDTALSLAEINAVRQENLGYGGDLSATPGLLWLKGFPGGGCGSRADGVSADGSFIVGSADLGYDNVAFRWHDGVCTPLGDLPGGLVASIASDVSDDGSVVVGYSNSTSGDEAFRWTSNVMTGLGDLPTGLFGSYAEAVSASGSVVVGRGTPGASLFDPEGFRWENNLMTGLGYIVGASIAYDITPDASVIVGVTATATGVEACRWDGGSITALGELPEGNVFSIAEAISADGSTIVGYSNTDRGDEATRWKNGQISSLGEFPDGFHQAFAHDVSGNGAVIVGEYLPASGGTRAFIWDALHGLRDLGQVLSDDYGLSLGNSRLRVANAISSDGQVIVGWGSNPDGGVEAWRVRVPAVSHSTDFNHDNLVNEEDLDIFEACATGPAIRYDPANLPPGCTAAVSPMGVLSADFDEDGDVDSADFGKRMQPCLTLPPAVPPAECLE